MIRLYICYAFHGSGHHAAAKALRGALLEFDPEADVELLDFFRFLYPRLGLRVQALYLGMLKATPFLWRLLYDGRLAGGLAQGWKKTAPRRLMALRDRLTRFRPDAIVCTQASPFLFLDAGMTPEVDAIPLAGVVTDFIPHRLWAGRGRGLYFVPTSVAAERLVQLGVKADRVRITGIPVALSSRRIRYPPHRLDTVLVMGGGFGLHVTAEQIRQLDRIPHAFSVHVVAGRNEALKRALEEESFHHPVRVEGYVPHLVESMSRATLVVTKPGGMTVAEALAMGKPLVLLPPLPGQECRNRDFLLRAGAAVSAERGDLDRVVADLFEHPERLVELRARAERLGRPDAARDIIQSILQERFCETLSGIR